MPEELIPIVFIITAGLLLLPVSIGMTIRALRGPRTPLPPSDETESKVLGALQQVRDELALHREEMHRLGERQQFVEALLDKRSEPAALPKAPAQE